MVVDEECAAERWLYFFGARSERMLELGGSIQLLRAHEPPGI
jgi:hypothetical protein